MIFFDIIISNSITILFWYTLGNFIRQDLRWYTLHSIANIIIIILTYKDLYHTLTQKDKLNYKSEYENEVDILNLVITSLHLYHITQTQKLEDLIHHITAILLFNLSIIYIQGSYCGSILFFMNGLPGLLDYILLIMTKLNYINKLLEKKYNTYLNIYIRSLGTIFILGMIYNDYKNSEFTIYICLGGIIFNVQYYTREVCINYGKKICK